MVDDTDIQVGTPFRTFVVRVAPVATPRPAKPPSELARVLLAELRFGLAAADPALVRAAQQLQQALLGGGASKPRSLGASLDSQRARDQLATFLADEVENGRLLVLEEPPIANVPEQELTVRRPKLAAEPAEVQPKPRAAAPLETSFEVRFVDEVGQGISGLEVEIAADRVENVTTNAAGVALLEGTTAGSGTVTAPDPAALSKILEPRWTRRRTGTAGGGLNSSEQSFDGQALEATSIKAGVPNTVIIKPQLGVLFAELWDKRGRSRHAKRDYTITGPMQLSGTTDEQGQLFHEDVFPGTYTLKLSLDFFEGKDRVTDTYEATLVVQAP